MDSDNNLSYIKPAQRTEDGFIVYGPNVQFTYFATPQDFKGLSKPIEYSFAPLDLGNFNSTINLGNDPNYWKFDLDTILDLSNIEPLKPIRIRINGKVIRDPNGFIMPMAEKLCSRLFKDLNLDLHYEQFRNSLG